MKHASILGLLAVVGLSSVASASLDKDLIRGRIRAHMVEFRACYEKALEKNPKLEGKVLVVFVVGMDGKVSDATGSGLPPVDACVAKVVTKIEFPKNNRGSFTVNYPFLFTPDRR